MEDEAQYVCGRCNGIFIEGNLMISHDEKQERIEYFYCTDCFFKLFEIQQAEEFIRIEDGQENSQDHGKYESSGEGCQEGQTEGCCKSAEESRKEE